jgi:hypothetical protein
VALSILAEDRPYPRQPGKTTVMRRIAVLVEGVASNAVNVATR